MVKSHQYLTTIVDMVNFCEAKERAAWAVGTVVTLRAGISPKLSTLLP